MKLVLKILAGMAGLAMLAVIALGVLLVGTAQRPVRSVGVAEVLVPDPAHEPIHVTLFYPTEAKPRLVWLGTQFAQLAPRAAVAGGPHPLIVISHGTGGGAEGHLDTALALAQAGYVVAAPTHPGDNYRESGAVGAPDWLVDRARHVRQVDDYLLRAWKGRNHLDPERVGFFGFSAGATTGLIAIGGEPDLGTLAPHCKAHPEFACQLVRPGAMRPPAASEWTHDPRIKAAVIVSPGFGFAFAPHGLSKVSAPVQLWLGELDTSVPYASNAGVARGLLRPPPEFHSVPNAGHFSFLAPCGVLGPPLLCRDSEGFDRKAFHDRFNRDVVEFFQRTLPPEAR